MLVFTHIKSVLMSCCRIFTALFLTFTGLYAAEAPPDLKDFRTVSTAKTTTIEKASATTGARPGYLGVEFANGDSAAPLVAGIVDQL